MLPFCDHPSIFIRMKPVIKKRVVSEDSIRKARRIKEMVDGGLKVCDACRIMSLSHVTFYRAVKSLKASE